MNQKMEMELILKAMSYLFNDSLGYIFKEKNIVEKATIVSFDKDTIYLFKKDSDVVLVPHKGKILEETYGGWSAYLRQKKDLGKYIPKKYLENQIISGGMYSVFLEKQKKKKTIYTTKQSYISTIIHEYAHIYFNKLNPFYYSDQKYTLELLDISEKLYKGKSFDTNYKLFLPAYTNLTEVFAFCVEYEFAKKYAKNHFKNMNDDFLKRIELLKNLEKKRDFKKEDSVLADAHVFSWVLGKMILGKYKDDWVDRLTKRNEL